MEIMQELLNNPGDVTFTALFIGLFVYTMKTNESREQHYREAIKRLTDELKHCETFHNKLNDYHEEVRQWQRTPPK